MTTVEIKVYEFNELSETAKRKAIDDYLSSGIDASHIYDEAYQSVKEFMNVFSRLIQQNRYSDSWLSYSPKWNDDLEDMNALRLRTYMINNYGYILFKGKYYGKLVETFKDGSKIPVSKKHPIGTRHVKRYSKCQFVRDFNLTGVCYDQMLLDPFYSLIDFKDEDCKYINIEDLFNDAFSSLERTLQEEVEYMESDEAIQEVFEANDMRFMEDGTEFKY